MRVHELMSTDVITATAETGLKQIARLMLGNEISGIPIVDDEQRLIGIITEADIVHHESVRASGDRPGIVHALLGDDEAQATTAGEAMTTHVFTTTPEVDHTIAARLMETRGVKRLPVVDVDGHVVGIISRADIMTSFARPDELIEDEIQVDILERILWIQPGTVAIEVDDGSVMLKGSLPNRSDARILEALTKRLDGVIDVDTTDLHWDVDDTKTGQPPSRIFLR